MSHVKIIKPEAGEGVYPVPEIRQIYPTRRLLFKYYQTAFDIWCTVAFGLFCLGTFISFVAQIDTPSSEPPLPPFLVDAFIILFIVASVIAFLLVLILSPIYIKSMEFIVHGDEVVVKKGLFNKTAKYCPFRTVTNISTTAGPFDRLFGIGCVNIETAGKGLPAGPEEKLEGLILYKEIRDYILFQLRAYDPLKAREVTPVASSDLQVIQQETITELKEIKRILRKKKGE